MSLEHLPNEQAELSTPEPLEAGSQDAPAGRARSADGGDPQGTGSWWQPLGALGLGLALAFLFHGVAILVIVLVLIAIIIAHEAGHFVMAKLSGMKVTEFFVGFGPRVWSFKKGETEYGVKAIPAGGYVRIIGMTNLEEVDPEDEPRTYRQATFPRRLGVAVAGSTVHFLIALVLIWAMLALAGVPGSSGADIAALVPVNGAPGPAAKAGLRPGDVIEAIGGKPAGDVDQVSRVLRHARPGVPLRMLIEDHGHSRYVMVVPVPAQGATLGGQAPAQGSTAVFGVMLQAPVVTKGLLASIPNSFVDLGRFVAAELGAFGKVFSLHGLSQFFHELESPHYARVANEKGVPRLESVVGAIRTAAEASRAGITDVILVLVSIDLFLGIFNMVPLLPLDGGHVAIAIYERIRSTRTRHYHADAAKLAPLTYAVFTILIVIGLGAMYLDIAHPAANPFGLGAGIRHGLGVAHRGPPSG
jgi:membrane-associated protease RseP (regulator of RpoE activity)